MIEMLEKVVKRAEELAKLAPENPEYEGLVDPQTYMKANGYFESTATINISQKLSSSLKYLYKNFLLDKTLEILQDDPSHISKSKDKKQQ